MHFLENTSTWLLMILRGFENWVSGCQNFSFSVAYALLGIRRFLSHSISLRLTHSFSPVLFLLVIVHLYFIVMDTTAISQFFAFVGYLMISLVLHFFLDYICL